MPTLPLTIVPAPEGALLSREGVMSTLFALALRPGDSPLPITQVECDICRANLAETEWEGVEVGCRVLGDSRYGYAPKHVTCHYMAPCFCRACDRDVFDGSGVCLWCAAHGCTVTEPRCKVRFQALAEYECCVDHG